MNVYGIAYGISQAVFYRTIVEVTFSFFLPPIVPIYCKNIVGIVGENITFPVQTDQKIEEIVWKKDKNKVAEWEVQNIPTYFGRLRNRSVLMENGSLTIVNLEEEDAGTYELQYRDSEKDNYLSFVLTVFGKYWKNCIKNVNHYSL